VGLQLLGVSEGLTTSYCKKLVTKCYIGLQIWLTLVK
jgi:hypothetical protein